MPYDRKSLYEKFTDSELYPIGFPVLINKYADPSLKASSFVATKMKAVDLIPVGFILNYKAMTSVENASKADWLQYEFDFFIQEYRRKLLNFDLPLAKIDKTYGVRLWLSSSGNSGTETIQNQFTENSISSMIKQNVQNSAMGKLHETARSFGYGNALGSFSEGSTKGGRMLLNLLYEGRHVSLPNIWQESSYNNNVNFNINLSSPYGSLEAIKRFIAEPLLRLVALISPSSNDGITYGLPPYLYIRAYGMTYIRLGVPSNLSISRGQDDRINKYKQPLDINVTLQLDTAIPGFASLIPNNKYYIDPNVKNTSQPGVDEDVSLSDLTKVPKGWGYFGGSEDELSDIHQILKNTKSGPALNTLGNILKSLMPSPPDVISEVSYDIPALNKTSDILDMLSNLTSPNSVINLNQQTQSFAPTIR